MKYRHEKPLKKRVSCEHRNAFYDVKHERERKKERNKSHHFLVPFRRRTRNITIEAKRMFENPANDEIDSSPRNI